MSRAVRVAAEQRTGQRAKGATDWLLSRGLRCPTLAAPGCAPAQQLRGGAMLALWWTHTADPHRSGQGEGDGRRQWTCTADPHRGHPWVSPPVVARGSVEERGAGQVGGVEEQAVVVGIPGAAAGDPGDSTGCCSEPRVVASLRGDGGNSRKKSRCIGWRWRWGYRQGSSSGSGKGGGSEARGRAGRERMPQQRQALPAGPRQGLAPHGARAMALLDWGGVPSQSTTREKQPACGNRAACLWEQATHHGCGADSAAVSAGVGGTLACDAHGGVGRGPEGGDVQGRRLRAASQPRCSSRVCEGRGGAEVYSIVCQPGYGRGGRHCSMQRPRRVSLGARHA